MSDLSESLQKYNISLPKIQRKKLEEYVQLLWTWNERINLTRHTDYDKFVSRDVIDSLALAEFLREGERVLDVGTGGGVPGIILAIVRPDLNIELCDSTGKKALAVSEMLQEMRLHVPVHHAKAEMLLAEKGRRYTTLTIRAVSKLAVLLRQFAPCWSSFDRMLLVKGPNWIAERGEARHYNLTTKLSLRRLKSYTPTTRNTAETSTEIADTAVSDTKNVESVILQLCLKENFDRLDTVIDEHSKTPHTHGGHKPRTKKVGRSTGS